MIVARMESLKTADGIPYIMQSRSMGIPYSSTMRWRYRIRYGRSPADKRGPKPVDPLNLLELHQKMTGIKHIRKRSLGTGELYREISDSISRRDFQTIVKEARLTEVRNRRKGMCRIDWRVPGMVWAFDDMEDRDPGFHRKHHIHSIRDMASRYIFEPCAGFREIPGEEIAPHLEKLFKKYGPPLFLKRDNGSNLNHHKVNSVLENWMVIPCNIPPYYPQFNGSIEQTQSELKYQMKRTIVTGDEDLSKLALIAASTLNHKPRPCLKGQVSCQVFFSQKSKMKVFHKRKRKEVSDKIHYYAMHIANDDNVEGSFDSARRSAILLWLRKNGAISMTNYEKCYPIFSTKIAHN